jgi:mRNA-decapping enzyme subunit 2
VTLKRNNRRNRNSGYLNRLPPPDESAESSSESPPHSHSVADNAQETSSQSNGPHTPSPKYGQLEPYVVKEDSSEKPIITADPHLARLMESLSMSALQGTSEPKPALSSIDIESRSPPPSAATPVPATASSVDSHPAAAWSADTSPETAVPPTLPPSEPQMTNGSSTPIHTARLPTSSLASGVSLSPRHQRSVSALSYPTRPAEIASSAKRMKQLALLESVVDESARLTPTIEQQRANLQGAMFNPVAPMIPRSAAASVPPQNTMSVLVPGSVLYSSDKGSGFPPRVQSIPPPINGIPPPLCSTFGHEPFTVRRFDSSLMNPAPLHASNGLLPGMPGAYAQAVPPPPQLHSVPQYNQQISGPPTPNIPPFPRPIGSQPYPGQYGGRITMAQNPLSARPQSTVPYPSKCPPLNTPGVGPQPPFPGFSPQLSQPKGNPQLLSILNNRGSGTAGFQTSAIPPVGMLTNVQPR